MSEIPNLNYRSDEDGVWLRFSSKSGKDCLVSCRNLAYRATSLEVEETILEWEQDRLDELTNGEATTANASPDEAMKSLQSLMELIDDGVLVRNISHDGEDGWALSQLRLVSALSRASDVIINMKDVRPKKVEATSGDQKAV